MKTFRVEALEKFIVRTVYEGVAAATAEEAAERCKSGKEAYESSETEEGDEEWIETVSVEEE